MDWKTLTISIATGAASLAVNPALAQDDDQAVRLNPSTPWNLDYAEDSCALRRIFGEEGSEVYLSLRQYGPGEGITTTIASDDFRRLRRFRQLEVSFMPDDAPMERGFAMALEIEGFGEGALFTTTLLGADDRARSELALEEDVEFEISDEQRNARESEIRSLQIDRLFRDDIVLETGSMHPPMEAMRACLDELLTHWGVDVDAHRELTRQVAPLDQEIWVRPIVRSYPSSGLRRGQQGYVRVRLSVSTGGRATDCAVQSDFNDPIFDETACRELLRHSRFEPALDADGEPIASYWTTTVIYHLN